MATKTATKPYVIIFQDANRKVQNALCDLKYNPFSSKETWLALSEELRKSTNRNCQAIISVHPLGAKSKKFTQEKAK